MSSLPHRLRRRGNSAEENGGAIYIDSIGATFTKLTVKDNSALGNGGGIYLNNGQLTLTQNSDVDSNTLFLVRVVPHRQTVISHGTVQGSKGRGDNVYCTSAAITLECEATLHAH